MKRHVFIFNPKNYDFLCASLIEGLNELGLPYTAFRQTNYARTNRWDRSWRKISDNDLIFDFTNSKAVRRFLSRLGHANVFRVDGGDQMSTTLEDRKLYRGLFKRELPSVLGDRSSYCIWPMPFAAENRYFLKPSSSRNIFLSCMLDKKNKPFRSLVEAQLMMHAEKTWFVGSTGERAGHMGLGSSLPTPKYHEILSRSCVSVNVMGAGYDCGRFWEIPAAQVALLSQVIPLQMPYPFTDGENAIFYDSADELLVRIGELERGVLNWQKIASAGHEHVLNFHTTSHRAKDLISKAIFAIEKGLRADWDYIEREKWGRGLFNNTLMGN